MPQRIAEHFTVREQRVRGLSEAVERLSQEARTRGLGPIRLDLADHGSGDSSVAIALSTMAPAIGKYDLLARIDHLKGDRVYIRPLGMAHLDFAEIRANHASKKCDHCGLKRQRKVTYLLASHHGGEVQVGSSCLQSYVGDSDPRKALVQADLFGQARELVSAAIGREPQDSPRKIKPPAVDEYLAHVAAVIASEGAFVRKADVDSEDASTAVIAMENYRLEQLDERDASGNPVWIELRESERVLVDRSKEDFRELAEKNGLDGYDRALLTALDKNTAWPDKQGILATLFERVHSLRKKYGQGFTAGEDPWLGSVGERVDFEADLLGTGTPVESKFGEQVPHYFVTEAGKRATWFATNKHLEVGRRYHVRGEVKRHDTFQGRASTVLTNCRTEPLEQ